jgi:hypothetical protein
MVFGKLIHISIFAADCLSVYQPLLNCASQRVPLFKG